MNTGKHLLSLLVLSLFFLGALDSSAVSQAKRPNIVVIFTDDLGYGDLGVFGNPTIRTPNLDRMAKEGQKWTNFYASASVCTPSRAGLLTGRLAIRSGLAGNPRVLFEWSAGGLPDREITIAEGLKKAGYATACIGKWHLGHLPRFLPTNQGFDYYYGIPYSNDMKVDPDMAVAEDVKFRKGMTLEQMRDPDNKQWGWAPLLENEQVIEYPANQNTLTRRYTKKTTKFIRKHRDERFFIYYPHTFPHVPLYTSEKFRGNSRRGTYGDVVEEIDWSVGRIMETLRKQGIAKETLVVFTSDNGPWLVKEQNGGSSGLLRNGKGTTWEGGMREPTIMWWPDTLDEGVVMEMGSTLDLFQTFMKLAGVDVPDDRTYDGYDLRPVLFGEGSSPRDEMFYYRADELYAARKGPYKAHFITQGVYGQGPDRQEHDPPKLYNLNEDPAERFNVADRHPDVIEEIKTMVEEHRETIKPVEDQLSKRQGTDKTGDFDLVLGGTISKYNSGYRFDSQNAEGSALYELETPIASSATLNVSYKTLVDQQIRNGMLVLSDRSGHGNTSIKIGSAIGGNQHVIFFNDWGGWKDKITPPDYDQSALFELTVDVDLNKDLVRGTIDERIMESSLPEGFNKITHIGYYVRGSETMFNPIKLNGDPLDSNR